MIHSKNISNQELKIIIPNTHFQKIAYVVEYLFETCLGLTYELQIGSERKGIKIEVGNSLIYLPCDFEYLFKPVSPIESNISIGSSHYPIVNLYDNKNKSHSRLDVDIFCCTFWFLSRYEEYDTHHLDHHNRFDLSKSILNTYSSRPIVQEYVEVLFALLKHEKSTIIRKSSEVRKVMSHDIDRLFKWKTVKTLGGEMTRILKGKSIWNTNKALSSYFNTKVGNVSDPFDNLNLLTDIYQEQGWETIMYFGTHSNNKRFDHFDYDVRDNNIKRRIKDLRQRGVIIGLHPSYDSYNSLEMLVKEKDRLEQVIGESIVHSRQHYLRFKNPDTFRILHQAGIQYDSTLGYYDRMGFRCGTSIPFQTFDLEMDQKLDLKEIPLLCMDTHTQQMDQDIENTIQTVEKYGGTVMVLIHNSSDYLLTKILLS